MHKFLERIITDLNNSVPDSVAQDLDRASRLKELFFTELEVDVRLANITESKSGAELVGVVAANLGTNGRGQTIPDIFGEAERLAKGELHNSVTLHWFDTWEIYGALGGWLSQPDSLDFLELHMSFCEEFGVDTDSNLLDNTVADTIKRLWRLTRSSYEKA